MNWMNKKLHRHLLRTLTSLISDLLRETREQSHIGENNIFCYNNNKIIDEKELYGPGICQDVTVSPL